MRLGFYANYTKDTAQFAYETGFKSLELSAWPGSALEAGKVTPAEIKAIQKDLASKDIEISALGYYPNYLDKNEAEAKEAQRYFLQVLDLAKQMGIGVVATFAGRNQSKSVEAEHRSLQGGLLALLRRRREARHQDRHRELPDDGRADHGGHEHSVQPRGLGRDVRGGAL